MRATEINIFLLRKKITQKEIAERLGLHKSTVSLLLSGTLRLENRLDQIAKYCGISRRQLNDLIADNKEKDHAADTPRRRDRGTP